MANDPDAGAIGGPAIVVDKGGDPIHDIRHDQANLNWINEYGEQDSEANCWVPPEPIEVDQLIGANMSFRRSLLVEIGGFDPTYPGLEIYEDTDVMVRIRDRDLPIIYDPSLRIEHYAARGGNAYWYWFARCCIHFRYRRFRDVFPKSMQRLLTNDSGEYLAAWKQLGSVVLRRNTTPLWIWRGWLAGLRDVITGNADPELVHFDEQ
jgi:GT2 family glycosyltransferase